MTVTQHDLEELDRAAVQALESLDYYGLNIIGYGELTVALGWPLGAPTAVCKPVGPTTRDECAQYSELIGSYLADLRRRGIGVVDTDVRSVERSPGSWIVYMVQDLLDTAQLADRMLLTATPDPDHPIVESLVDVVAAVDPSIGIDAQVTNWHWSSERLELLDVGAAMMWDENGASLLNPGRCSVRFRHRCGRWPRRTFES